MIDFRKTAVGQLAQNALKLRGQAERILSEVLRRPEARNFIIKLQEEQLRFGIRGDGSEMPPSNPNYVDSVRRREGFNQKPTFKINLLNTGRFYDTIDVIYGRALFEIVADMSIYGENFQSLYGDGRPILGLNEESLNDFVEFIYPMFREEVIKQLWE